MTFDPKTVDTQKTLANNNAWVVMTSPCYVICRCTRILNIFRHFDRKWPQLTFDLKSVQQLLCARGCLLTSLSLKFIAFNLSEEMCFIAKSHFWPLWPGQRSDEGQSHMTGAGSLSGHVGQVWLKSVNAWWRYSTLTERTSHAQTWQQDASYYFNATSLLGVVFHGRCPNMTYFSCV